MKCDSKNEIAMVWEVDLKKQIEDQAMTYGCLNVNCRSVFREWLAIKLYYVAMVGFTLTAIFIIMIIMCIKIWRRMSNG